MYFQIYMNILVAGGSGFVGTNLINKLYSNKNIKIKATFNKRKPIIKLKNVSYTKCDLTNYKECLRVLNNVDVVFMFASTLSTVRLMKKEPLGPIRNNTTLNINMLEASYKLGIKNYIWLSSSTGYPESSSVLKEEDFFLNEPPVSYLPVGYMHRYIEKLCKLYYEASNKKMNIVVLRPSAIYGVYDNFDLKTCHILPAFIKQFAEKDKFIEIYGNGEQKRDWVFIDDLIEACLFSLKKLYGYNVINIVSGKLTSSNEIIKILKLISKNKTIKIIYKKTNNIIPKKRSFDATKAFKTFGFKSKTSIYDGLKKTYIWYCNDLVSN